MSRLTNSFLFNSISTPLDGHVYQYDRENQRTNEIRETDSSTVAYSYDNIGQLTVADSSVPAEDRGYTYDTAWNLNFRTNNGSLSTFIPDNKNQLTNSFAARNVYDSNGNMVTNNNNQNVLVYDDENELTRYFHYQNGINNPTAGDTRTDFVYDGLNRMRKRIEWVWTCNPQQSPLGGAQPNSGGGGGGSSCVWGEVSETWYVYDGRRVIQERDSNNVPTVSYTRGNDLSVSLEGAGGIGGLLARSSGYSSGNWSSHADYYADANGNVTSLTDGNQSVVASYRYDPFGNIISKSGTLANANVYRFSSKEVHVASGMYYYGYRFYDPNLQRWINRDPLGDIASLPYTTAHGQSEVERDSDAQFDEAILLGAWTEVNRNLYGTTDNNPINEFDANGLSGTLTIFSNGDGGSSSTSGHSWVCYAPDGGTPTTYGTWGNRHPLGERNGLRENLEQGRQGESSRSKHIDDAAERRLTTLIDKYRNKGEKGWKLFKPCSSFACDAWKAGTGEKLSHGFPSTPSTLKKSIINKNRQCP
jgi:RHS repeat-associated protein